MSEIVLGAIIGIVGAIVGAVVTGLSSYIITRLQLNSRREELLQQLKYQERESQRNRLIESRKEILLRLRNTISELVDAENKQTAMDVRLSKVFKGYSQESTEQKLAVSEFIRITEKLQSLSSDFEILRTQLSDSKLAELIDVLRKTQYEIDAKRLPLIRFFNEPGSSNINDLEAAMKEDQSLMKDVRKQAIQVNKRIEELLCGDPCVDSIA